MAITLSDGLKVIAATELSEVIDRVCLCNDSGIQVSNEVASIVPEVSGNSLVNSSGWSTTFTLDDDYTGLDLHIKMYNNLIISGRTLIAQVSGGPYDFTSGDIFVLNGFNIEIVEA